MEGHIFFYPHSLHINSIFNAVTRPYVKARMQRICSHNNTSSTLSLTPLCHWQHPVDDTHSTPLVNDTLFRHVVTFCKKKIRPSCQHPSLLMPHFARSIKGFLRKIPPPPPPILKDFYMAFGHFVYYYQPKCSNKASFARSHLHYSFHMCTTNVWTYVTLMSFMPPSTNGQPMSFCNIPYFELQ